MKTPELKFLLSTLLSMALLAACAAASAQDSARQQATHAFVLLNQKGVAYDHLDLWNRNSGIASYEQGDKVHALFLFKQAALYGDKPAEAMIASMYWSGDGMSKDRPLAYAWMDLAADRGYPKLLAQRELYWSQLSAGERHQALAAGKTVYAKYGDAEATKRLTRNLAKIRRNITGSHTGFVAGDLEITVMGVGNRPGEYSGKRFDGSKFYAPSLTTVAGYQKLKDRAWAAPNYYPGTVTVEPLQQVKGSTTKQAADATQDPGDSHNP